MTAGNHHGPWRVLVVEDDALIASLVADGLRSFGHEVVVCPDPSTAWASLRALDPHVLVSDLNFPSGESGAGLIARVRSTLPWVAVVVLSNHRSPELAVADAGDLPHDVVYLVKSMVSSVHQLHDGVVAAMIGDSASASALPRATADEIAVTRTHAEVLRMLADGASTRALAEARGTSVRAVESLLVRLYRALGIDLSSETNPRVVAIKLWQSGRVRVARRAVRENVPS